jgi:hypothetical protein
MIIVVYTIKRHVYAGIDAVQAAAEWQVSCPHQRQLYQGHGVVVLADAR